MCRNALRVPLQSLCFDPLEQVGTGGVIVLVQEQLEPFEAFGGAAYMAPLAVSITVISQNGGDFDRGLSL